MIKCCFISIINFDFLNPFIYRYIRFNLWDIFRFIFRQLRMYFFHKTMVFLQMHNTIWQRLKQFLNVKMINLEKFKLGNSQPPYPLQKTCPCTILPTSFLIFQIPPSKEHNQTLLTPFSKKSVWEGVGKVGGWFLN